MIFPLLKKRVRFTQSVVQVFAQLSIQRFAQATFKPRSVAQAAFLTLGLTLFVTLLYAAPAFAHHPLGGTIPSNWIEGGLSGLAHPIIGLDHFAFVVAIGLLAATRKHGFWLPVAFLCSALVGTGVHLLNLDLPAPEIFISLSVLIFGIMLAIQARPQLPVLVSLGAIAGLFHGYAYGEAIIGATAAPLIAYLIGFTCIQLVIALSTYAIAKKILHTPDSLKLRYIGFVLCGIGAAFFSAALGG
jgi:urease accessory protein